MSANEIKAPTQLKQLLKYGGRKEKTSSTLGMQLCVPQKNIAIASGTLEPAMFQFIVQYLNH